MFIKADNPQVDDTEYLFWCYFLGSFFKKSSVPCCITNIICIFAVEKRDAQWDRNETIAVLGGEVEKCSKKVKVSAYLRVHVRIEV